MALRDATRTLRTLTRVNANEVQRSRMHPIMRGNPLLSSRDVQGAREAVERVLEELGMRAFAYTVEPKEGGWSLRIECATDDGWLETTLQVDPVELRSSLGDPAAREKLRADWQARLCGCAKREPQPAARWEHYPHEADMGVRGFGSTKAEAFEQAALALTAVITDPAVVEQRDSVTIECQAGDDEMLFAEWLNNLVFEMATRGMLFSRFAVRIEGSRLNAQAWGERVEVARHRPAVEVKGATYTTLRVARQGSGWMAQTVVDV